MDDYEFSRRSKLRAGFNWLDRRAAAVDNTARVPGYVTFDAMLCFQKNKHLGVQLNGDVPGAGRTGLLTVFFAY
jgi:outer membrane receptor for monomeric catechols